MEQISILNNINYLSDKLKVNLEFIKPVFQDKSYIIVCSVLNNKVRIYWRVSAL